MKEIPKFPEVPDLSAEQISAITEATFLDLQQFPQPDAFDILFIFGGSHPVIWETCAQAYHEKQIRTVIITGGYKANATRHESWTYGKKPESHIIRLKLIELGVPSDCILFEDRSTNSLENVLFAQEILDFTKVQNALFSSKSFALGRQYRTLLKYMPSHIRWTPLPVPTTIKKQVVTRDGWHLHPHHRSIVYGEYLRILSYGQKGDIVPLSY